MVPNSLLPTQDLIQLLEADRLQTLSMVTGEILPRLKEPLQVIRARAEALKSQLENYQRDNAQGILDQVVQLENIFKFIEGLTASEASGSRQIPFHKVVEDLTLFFQPRLMQGKIEVMNLLPPDFSLRGSVTAFRQIFASLFLNAIEALEQRKTRPHEARTIFVQHQRVKENIVFSIEDNGDGMGPEELKNMFMPFHSNKEGHVGISLSLCRRLGQLHHWQLKVFSQKDQGTRLEIWMSQSS